MGPIDRKRNCLSYSGLLLWVALWILCPLQLLQAAPITDLFNSGVDDSGTARSPESAETHYSMTAPGGAGPEVVLYPHSSWVTPTADSAWIGPDNGNNNAGDGNESAPPGNYSYSLAFDLTGLIPSTATISGNWVSDNTSELFLNDAFTGLFRTAAQPFTDFQPFTINSGFTSGINTLRFDVLNAGSSPNPSGLIVADLSGEAAVPEPAMAILLMLAGLLFVQRRPR